MNAAMANIKGGLEKNKQVWGRPRNEYVANNIKKYNYSDLPVRPQDWID